MHPLITAAELADQLRTATPPRLLDVRWALGGPPGDADYAAGHLPGAVYVDLDRDLSGPPGLGGRHPLPDPAQLQQAMRGWGIDADTQVVAYDAKTSLSAARAWWILRWAGHDRVRVLDGGLAAWVENGGELVDDVPQHPPGKVAVHPGSLPAVTADTAAQRAIDGVLLDARPANRFRGEDETVDPVAGHIPGAISTPGTDQVDDTGRFLPPDALRAHFTQLGVTADGPPVGAYCGSGVTAAQLALALALIDIPADVYVGSWSDWITDPARPVATG